MKKILSAFFILLTLAAFAFTNAAAAAAKPEPQSDITAPPRPEDGKPKPFPWRRHRIEELPQTGMAPDSIKPSDAKARAALLMDCGSGTVLFAQREVERYPIASMCKIMSLLLIYEGIDSGRIDEGGEITVSEAAAGMGGSQAFLEHNGTYKIEDLIKCIVVCSANDATVAMAELIAGSEEGFVVMMNRRAKELGLTNTHFVNSTGLPQPGQYSCAKDVATMMRELIKHKKYFKYSRIWLDKIQHRKGRETEITNTNKLVRFYKGCDGGKTGYTSEAKHCIAATAVKEDMRLISVIIGAESSKERFGEASKLLNFGFANYASKQIVSSDRPLDFTMRVKGGKHKTVELVPAESYSILINKSEKTEYSIDYDLPDKVAAPIKKGGRVGTMSVIVNNEIVKEIELLAAGDVPESTFGDCIGDVLENW